jgi:NTE family protein
VRKPRIGIALGSGSARGWAHIGVLRALEQAGIVPEIVAGTSVGALVGAAYASGRLDALENWVKEIDWWSVIRYMDLWWSGVQGERLMRALAERVEDTEIAALPKPFGAVATDLYTGREVWMKDGSLLEAVRASIALPGLFSPVKARGTWLVDGGLVEPLPIALCRALGADQVIAVNLNSDIVGRNFNARQKLAAPSPLLERLGAGLQALLGEDPSEDIPSPESDVSPGLFDVMAGAIHIMQDRITRARLADNPPDVVLAPCLAHLGLIDFDEGEQSIAAGVECVQRQLPVLRAALRLPEAVAAAAVAAASPAEKPPPV